MLDTGIVRKVDDLGRIVIPMEMRRTLGIKVKDPLEIFSDGDTIVLRKPTDSCVTCGVEVTDENYYATFKDKRFCTKCGKAIAESF